MSKRNKIRYTATPKKEVLITLTGKVYLRLQDDAQIEVAEKGDLMLYPRCESLQIMREEDYASRGFAGYFKVDVFDGKTWQLVLLNDIFPENEHHFAKSEYAIDTYRLIMPQLAERAGTELRRTYREHYEPVADEDEA